MLPAAHTPPVYRIAGIPSTSTVAQPEKQPSASCQPGVGCRAGGCWRQCSRSVEVAWPQLRPLGVWQRRFRKDGGWFVRVGAHGQGRGEGGH